MRSLRFFEDNAVSAALRFFRKYSSDARKKQKIEGDTLKKRKKEEERKKEKLSKVPDRVDDDKLYDDDSRDDL